jgi:hypothetical protein
LVQGVTIFVITIKVRLSDVIDTLNASNASSVQSIVRSNNIDFTSQARDSNEFRSPKNPSKVVYFIAALECIEQGLQITDVGEAIILRNATDYCAISEAVEGRRMVLRGREPSVGLKPPEPAAGPSRLNQLDADDGSPPPVR